MPRVRPQRATSHLQGETRMWQALRSAPNVRNSSHTRRQGLVASWTSPILSIRIKQLSIFELFPSAARQFTARSTRDSACPNATNCHWSIPSRPTSDGSHNKTGTEDVGNSTSSAPAMSKPGSDDPSSESLTPPRRRPAPRHQRRARASLRESVRQSGRSSGGSRLRSSRSYRDWP